MTGTKFESGAGQNAHIPTPRFGDTLPNGAPNMVQATASRNGTYTRMTLTSGDIATTHDMIAAYHDAMQQAETANRTLDILETRVDELLDALDDKASCTSDPVTAKP